MLLKVFICSKAIIFLLVISADASSKDPRSLHFFQSGSLFTGVGCLAFVIQSRADHLISFWSNAGFGSKGRGSGCGLA